MVKTYLMTVRLKRRLDSVYKGKNFCHRCKKPFLVGDIVVGHSGTTANKKRYHESCYEAMHY